MHAGVNILYCISSALKGFSVHGVGKIRKYVAKKDAVLTGNLMFSNNPRLFFLFECNKINTFQIKWLSYKRQFNLLATSNPT